MPKPADKPKTARAIAADVLNRLDPRRNYAGLILNKLRSQTGEGQRATDLVCGTIRNRVAIDTVIARFTSCPVERIPVKVLNIIRIGTYEFIYSPASPGYSIVNEAVENTKAIAGKRQVGFVNAALRQIARHLSNRQNELSRANLRTTLPQTRLTGCGFDTCFLPDPKVSCADYLSTVFSLPGWLIDDWLGEFGEKTTWEICFSSNRRPSIYIRANLLKTTAKQLVERLHQAGIDAEIVESPMIKLKSPGVVTELPGFSEGQFTVQDISAAGAVWMLRPRPGWEILDLCAAPGTKTGQLAEQTGDQAKIVATDIDSERLEKVKENIARLGIKTVEIVEYERPFEDFRFDAVLLDVPCSNTGVLAKRIEVRYRLTPTTVEQISKIQSELLEKAAQMIKPTGKICYSTCSIQKKENSGVVEGFLQKSPEFRLETERLTLPSAQDFDHDGSYVAILVKK